MSVFDKLEATADDHVGISREGPLEVRPKTMERSIYAEKTGPTKGGGDRLAVFSCFQGQRPVVIFNDTGKSVRIKISGSDSSLTR